MKRAVIYSRVSTSDQNLSNQEIRLKKYLEMKGWELTSSYSDKISGLKDHRPGLDKLLHDARKRKFDVVVSVKLDRLGRSTKHLLMLVEELHHFNVDIAFTDQPIDTTGPMGRLIFTVLGAVAEFERELIVERTKAGQERAKREGKHIGRKPLDLSPDTIERIKVQRSKGISYQKLSDMFGISKGKIFQICKDLNVQKVGASK